MPNQPATASDTVLIFLTWATASSSTTRTLTEEQVIYSSMVTFKVKLPSIQSHLIRFPSMRSRVTRLLLTALYQKEIYETSCYYL